MRSSTLFMIIAAGVVALIAAFSVKSLMDSQVTRAARSAESGNVTQVLVAARPIGTGTVLTAADLRYDKWPKSAVGPQNRIRTEKDDPARQLVGSVVRYNIAASQPILATSVFKPERGSKLAGILDPGMRAVTINVTAESSVAGLAAPGDYVDVILSADMSRLGGERAKHSREFARHVSESILENVKLLAIDQTVTQEGGGGEKGAVATKAVGKTATLEVTPEQAEKLVLAGQMGKMSLVLRSAGRKEGESRDGEYTPDLSVSSALNSLMGRGKRSAQEPQSAGGGGGGSVTINRGGNRTGF